MKPHSSLVTRKMQTKTLMRYTMYTPEWLELKRWVFPSFGEHTENSEPLIISGGNLK
jgi:hypothetical protein